MPPLLRSQSAHSNLLIKPLDISRKLPEDGDDESHTAKNKLNVEPEKTNAQNSSVSSDESTSSQKDVLQLKEPKPSVDIDDHNRTMVLQVDRTDLRLISPDRKVILLHKHHKDITTCIQVSIINNLVSPSII